MSRRGLVSRRRLVSSLVVLDLVRGEVGWVEVDFEQVGAAGEVEGAGDYDEARTLFEDVGDVL